MAPHLSPAGADLHSSHREHSWPTGTVEMVSTRARVSRAFHSALTNTPQGRIRAHLGGGNAPRPPAIPSTRIKRSPTARARENSRRWRPPSIESRLTAPSALPWAPPPNSVKCGSVIACRRRPSWPCSREGVERYLIDATAFFTSATGTVRPRAHDGRVWPDARRRPCRRALSVFPGLTPACSKTRKAPVRYSGRLGRKQCGRRIAAALKGVGGSVPRPLQAANHFHHCDGPLDSLTTAPARPARSHREFVVVGLWLWRREEEFTTALALCRCRPHRGLRAGDEYVHQPVLGRCARRFLSSVSQDSVHRLAHPGLPGRFVRV